MERIYQMSKVIVIKWNKYLVKLLSPSQIWTPTSRAKTALGGKLLTLVTRKNKNYPLISEKINKNENPITRLQFGIRKAEFFRNKIHNWGNVLMVQVSPAPRLSPPECKCKTNKNEKVIRKEDCLFKNTFQHFNTCRKKIRGWLMQLLHKQ